MSERSERIIEHSAFTAAGGTLIRTPPEAATR
jgi:hypothetical protein